MQDFERSLELKREAGYKKGIGYSLFDIAEVLRREDRLEDARATAEQSLAARKELADEVDVAENQVQLAEISLQEQNPGEAESLARTAVAVFEKHRITNKEAVAAAALTESLVVESKAREARASSQKAMTLASQSQDIAARFEAELARASVQAALGGVTEAESILEHLQAEAGRRRYVGYQLEAELALGKLEIKSGSAAGRARLARLEQDASMRGFSFIAHQAASAESDAKTKSIQSK
jgi:hypothetical protein